MFTLLYVLARFRRPVRLLECPDRASLLHPRGCGGLVANPLQGSVPVSGVFPAGAAFRLLETRLQVIRLSPYRADLPARHPVRLGMCCRLAGMLFSHLVFQPPVSHQIQRQSPPVPARCTGNTTVHLMAHRLLRALRRHRTRVP
jgi:hypothetical protein